MPAISGSVRKANSPSATSMVGRSAGIASGQCSSANETGTECDCGAAGSTSSRSAVMPGRSTLYQSTVDGGPTR